MCESWLNLQVHANKKPREFDPGVSYEIKNAIRREYPLRLHPSSAILHLRNIMEL